MKKTKSIKQIKDKQVQVLTKVTCQQVKGGFVVIDIIDGL